MKIKKLIKSFTPPIAYSLKQYLIKDKSKPSWHEFKGGILRGMYFFTNQGNVAFKSMINGDYDYFFWDYLDNIKLSLDGNTVIDIGAHIGFHSLSFAKLVGPNGNVMSFEPNPFNIERLKMNVSKNKSLADRVSFYPVALGEDNGKAIFNFSSNVDNMTSSGGFLDGIVTSYEKSVYKKADFVSKEIEMRKLDFIVNSNKISNIKLLKIDVEGAEAMVLRGGLELIKKFKPVLMIEIHNVVAMLDVCRIILPIGYKVEVLQVDKSSRCFIGAKAEE